MSAKATWPITMQIYQITMLYILNSQCCMSIISQKRGGGGDRKNGYFPTKCKPLFRSGVHTSYQPCRMAWLVKTLHVWLQLAPLFNSSAILLCNKSSVRSVRLMMSTSLRLSAIQKKTPSLH